MPENGPGIQSRPPPAPEPIELTVLYEDEWLMAIDKPPGMVVHPTYRNWSGTLLNGLLWRLRDRAPGPKGPGLHPLLPRIVTRLDKDTSGLVLVALTSESHKRLQRDATARLVTKTYLAIVRGTPEPARGSIEMPLARSAEDRRRVVVDAAGRPSHTDYEVLSAANGHALVRCELVTGRTHQIRVHLASRGWPMVGDRTYGEPHERLARQALHAWRMTLPHPASREPLRLEAPMPGDLTSLLGSVFKAP
jgi:23S rRNA pseudouridine1911/1915/1917 synthase